MTGLLGALASADTWLLLKINRDWANPVFDAVLPALTDAHKARWLLWGPGPAGIAYWLWRGRRRALQVLVAAAVAVSVGDVLAYRVVKPWVGRPRPIVAGLPVVLRAPVNGTLSFPSNHAVNTAAAASVLIVAYPEAAPAFAGVAALVGFSRVYVGAHYPGDVLGGFALGAALGAPLGLFLFRKRRKSGFRPAPASRPARGRGASSARRRPRSRGS